MPGSRHAWPFLRPQICRWFGLESKDTLRRPEPSTSDGAIPLHRGVTVVCGTRFPGLARIVTPHCTQGHVAPFGKAGEMRAVTPRAACPGMTALMDRSLRQHLAALA